MSDIQTTEVVEQPQQPAPVGGDSAPSSGEVAGESQRMSLLARRRAVRRERARPAGDDAPPAVSQPVSQEPQGVATEGKGLSGLRAAASTTGQDDGPEFPDEELTELQPLEGVPAWMQEIRTQLGPQLNPRVASALDGAMTSVMNGRSLAAVDDATVRLGLHSDLEQAWRKLGEGDLASLGDYDQVSRALHAATTAFESEMTAASDARVSQEQQAPDVTLSPEEVAAVGGADRADMTALQQRALEELANAQETKPAPAVQVGGVAAVLALLGRGVASTAQALVDPKLSTGMGSHFKAYKRMRYDSAVRDADAGFEKAEQALAQHEAHPETVLLRDRVQQLVEGDGLTPDQALRKLRADPDSNALALRAMGREHEVMGHLKDALKNTQEATKYVRDPAEGHALHERANRGEQMLEKLGQKLMEMDPKLAQQLREAIDNMMKTLSKLFKKLTGGADHDEGGRLSPAFGHP